jgi:aldose 1-epimerase
MVAMSAPEVLREPFGTLPGGARVNRFSLRSRSGMQADILDYGGIVTRLTAPDDQGHYANVVLGFGTLADYLANSRYFGCLIGRHANRIRHGRFTVDGMQHQLGVNAGLHSLHGGVRGFDKVLWIATDAALTSEGPTLRLDYVSRDGEEGYPGTLSVSAVYMLMEDDSLRLDLTATTDKPTVVNLTQHSYFNLGAGPDVLGHLLQIPAQRFTVTDDTQIPTGELRCVADGPFDFRQPKRVGEDIGAEDEQLRIGNGYDHNWVIDKPRGELGLVASVLEPVSGRRLDVLSTAPGLQFYSGNSLDGSLTGENGRSYGFRSGLCLEPQGFPDAPNQPDFPSVWLTPGDTYRTTIIQRFTTL